MPQVEGKPQPMDWKSFAARRRLNIMAWVAHHRFTTYKQVKAWCANNNVEAPEKHQVAPYFPPKGKAPSKSKQADKAPAASGKAKNAKKKRAPKKKADSIVGS